MKTGSISAGTNEVGIMIEEVTRKDTINKDTVHKMLKNNKAYLKGLEAERRN